MAWTLAGAKARYGVPPADTTGDAALTQEMGTALLIAEHHCRRQFLFAASQTAMFDRYTSQTIQLSRFPIAASPLVTVSVSGNVLDASVFGVDYGRGRILFQYQQENVPVIVGWAGGFYAEGGIPLLPPDVELALYGILDVIHARSQAMSNGSGMSGSDGIESITIPDVGTVRFGKDAGKGGVIGGEAAFTDSWMLLQPYVVEGV